MKGLPDIISDTNLKAQFEAEGFKLLEFKAEDDCKVGISLQGPERSLRGLEG